MKYKNLKRFASITLAGAMALSLAAPAFAEDKSTTITGTYQEVVLQVTTPGDTSAIINPYGLPTPVMEDGETIISGEAITTGAPLIISNQSKVDLAVGVKGTITADGSAVIVEDETDVEVSQSPTAAQQPKNIWVQFEMFAAPDIDVENETDPSVTNPAYAKLKSDEADVKFSFDPDDTVEADDTLVLKAGQDEVTQKGGAAYIRLHGAVAKKPTTGTTTLTDDPWTENDGFTAKIIYSFEPSEYATEIDVTVGTVSQNSFSASAATITTSALPEGTVVSDPESQITVTVVNTTAAARTAEATAVVASQWTAGTRVFAGSLSSSTAQANDVLEVTVRIVDDNGNVFKGVGTVTVTT